MSGGPATTDHASSNMKQTFKAAIELLNGRKRIAGNDINKIKGSDDMLEWLKALNYTTCDLNKLNVIHIAGTNGKGSCAAFCASLLQSRQRASGSPLRIGLYTSPHLRHIRERICINGSPITEEMFTRRFFEIWELLPERPSTLLDIPKYLQLLALLAFHIFLSEGVDVAVVETHMGGRYDATNIIERPLITAVTAISLDHQHLLGPTLENIAWHKAGIFKPGSVALSVPQTIEVEGVLTKQGRDVGVEVHFIDIDASPLADYCKLSALRANLSLALNAVQHWLNLRKLNPIYQHELEQAIASYRWPGRFQRIDEDRISWYLDGAHNEASIRHAVRWYANSVAQDSSTDKECFLIFAHSSSRDCAALLKCLSRSLRDCNVFLRHAIFTTYTEDIGQPRLDRNNQRKFTPEIQSGHEKVWNALEPGSLVTIKSTIYEALSLARTLSSGHRAAILVTGSLHLVGGALHILESTTAGVSAPM